MKNRLPLWVFFLPLCLSFLGLLGLVLQPLPVNALRLSVFDSYQRLMPRVYEPAPVVVLDIDEASLARLGQWPWPRTVLADMVDRLDALGAAVVVFDVVFAEPDRTSPPAMADLWGLSGPERAALAGLPDHDLRFAQSLEGRPVVLGYTLEHGRASTLPFGDVPWRFVFQEEGALDPRASFTGATPSLPDLVAKAAGYGALSFLPDQDGVVRRVPLILGLNGAPVPSLVSEALRLAVEQKVHIVRFAKPAPGLAQWRTGPLSQELTETGEIWIHYTPPHDGRRLPAWRLWAAADEGPPLSSADIEGRIVLVGSPAPGLLDLRFSPLGGIIPGVDVHAQAIEQIILGKGLNRPKEAQALEALILLLASLLAGFTALTAPALLAAGVSVTICLGLAGGAWWAFSSQALLLDPSMAILTVLACFLVASLVRHRLTEQSRRYLKAAFARYVSPNRVEHLLSDPNALALGGERRLCSFIFTDLAGFTALMEKMDPAQAVSLLNHYLEGMIRIAFEHQGTLDRIVGDALAILFSAPLTQKDHAQRAVACAVAMKRFADAYAHDLQAKGIAFGRTRLGVHSGEVIVGNFGGQTMFDYRALGDAVNTAARLESVNKHLGTWICVSDFTLSLCEEPTWQSRPVGRLVLKGKANALKVYEIVDESTSIETLEAYRQAYALLEAGETIHARALFQKLADQGPSDPLVQLHVQRLREGKTDERMVMSEK
jgi:adenylate cyclase